MSKVVLKKDFKNGDILYDVDLNNNFAVIEAGINANEENLQEVIDQSIEELDQQLIDITADRGWDWNGGDRVTFFKGNTSQVNNKEITDGQLLYNTETGETAMDDDGERIITGSGNVVVVSETEPTNVATKEWIKPSEIVYYSASYVVDTMDGQSTNQSPSVHAVKDYVDEKNIEVYSTDEVKTNKVWANGKPIYRKTFVTNSITSSQTINLDLPETDESWIDVSNSYQHVVVANDNFEGNQPIPQYRSANNYVTLTMNQNNKTLLIEIGTGAYCRGVCVITINYTKTTD